MDIRARQRLLPRIGMGGCEGTLPDTGDDMDFERIRDVPRDIKL